MFSEVRRIENYRVEGMEIYSTTLWHLQKDVALSVLSKDLTDIDKNSPEVTVVNLENSVRSAPTRSGGWVGLLMGRTVIWENWSPMNPTVLY